MGEGELELCLPSPNFGRGAGGEGKDLTLSGFESQVYKIKLLLLKFIDCGGRISVSLISNIALIPLH